MRTAQQRTLTQAQPQVELVRFQPKVGEEPRRFLLRLQAQGYVLNGAGAPELITITVTEISDGVPFQHVFTLPVGGAPHPYRYSCDAIVVTASVPVSAGGAGASTISATLTDTPTGQGADAFNPQPCVPIVDARAGQLFTGAAALMMFQCILTVAPAGNSAPVYPMVFDGTAAGVSPLPLGVGPGLVTVGQADFFDDELAPGCVACATGFYVALSSTADTFTDAGATYQARFDGKVGT